MHESTQLIKCRTSDHWNIKRKCRSVKQALEKWGKQASKNTAASCNYANSGGIVSILHSNSLLCMWSSYTWLQFHSPLSQQGLGKHGSQNNTDLAQHNLIQLKLQSHTQAFQLYYQSRSFHTLITLNQAHSGERGEGRQSWQSHLAYHSITGIKGIGWVTTQNGTPQNATFYKGIKFWTSSADLSN